MKPKPATENPANGQPGMTFGNACVASGQKILTQISRARAAIFAESRHALRAPERLLRLALNEAEAAAWQTAYPHLVFPTLATEKVQAVAAWNETHQSMRRTDPVSALMA